MERITRINGNGQHYTRGLPKLVILGTWNDVALGHITENTGLVFVKGTWHNYEAQPTESKQIATLLMTYNFKTRYYDNGSTTNTLMLKSDHHVGFDVDSICNDCCIENSISVNGLDLKARLAT